MITNLTSKKWTLQILQLQNYSLSTAIFSIYWQSYGSIIDTSLSSHEYAKFSDCFSTEKSCKIFVFLSHQSNSIRHHVGWLVHPSVGWLLTWPDQKLFKTSSNAYLYKRPCPSIGQSVGHWPVFFLWVRLTKNGTTLFAIYESNQDQ